MVWIVRAFEVLFLFSFTLYLICGGVEIDEGNRFIQIGNPPIFLVLTVLPILFLAVIPAHFLQSSWLYKFAFESKALETINRKRVWILFLLFLANAILWVFVSLLRHWAFDSASFDLGIFTNVLWNLSNGYGYISSLKDGANLFTDHQSPILFLYSLFFTLHQKPEVLLILQGVILSSGGIAAYLLAVQYLGKNHRFLLAFPLIYFFNLAIRNANAFEFHPEITMLPCFLFGIWGAQSESFFKKVLGFTMLLLALASKETAGVVLTGVGLAWAAGAAPNPSQRSIRVLGVGSAIVGVTVFYANVWLLPNFFGKESIYPTVYSQLGTSLIDVVLSPILRPESFFSLLLREKALTFLFWTLASTAFIPILGFRAFIAAIPSYALILLGSEHWLRGVFHYGIEISVGIFWALPLGLRNISKFAKRSGLHNYRYSLYVWCLFWIVIANAPGEFYRIRKFQTSIHHKWLHSEFIKCVSPALSASASGHFVPHMAARNWIRHLPDLHRIDGRPVSCVFYDSNLGNWPIRDPNRQKATMARVKDIGYREVYQCRSMAVFEFQETEERGPCLVCKPNCY